MIVLIDMFMPIYMLCALGSNEVCIPVDLTPVPSHEQCVSVLRQGTPLVLKHFPGTYIYSVRCMSVQVKGHAL